MKQYTLVALSFVLGVPACADKGAPSGTNFNVNVSPLTLPGLAEACYRLSVYNIDDLTLLEENRSFVEENHTVWSLDQICSGQYGNQGRGAISYVATCDASEGNITNPAYNIVELELEDLWVADQDDTDGEFDGEDTWWDDTLLDILSAPGDYANPCSAANGYCQLVKPCYENTDTEVKFDLNVMRAARQGFYDVLVNFSDVFCSAKFDCAYPGDDNQTRTYDDENITMLFDADGHRASTGILGFACSSGAANAIDDNETYLYMDDINVTCTDEFDNIVYTELLETHTDEDGNQYFPPDPYGFGPVFQYAVYRGNEFPNGGVDFNKVFWNVAIGFDVGAMQGLQCTLSTKATASSGLGDTPWNQGLPYNETIAGTVYPYLSWEINLNDPFNTGPYGGLTCGANPAQPRPSLDVLYYNQSGVFIEYTDLPEGTVTFDHCGHDAGDGFETHWGTCDSFSEALTRE